MPTKENTHYAKYWKRDLQIDQPSNSGIDSTTRSIQSGDGVNTAIGLSDDQLIVKPQNDNTTNSFVVTNKGGSNILTVDTTNSLVKCGSSQVNPLTLIKEFGIYDFSPSAGYHYPLISNTMFIPNSAADFQADNDWGNGTDPPTTFDVSGLTQQENAVAVYWYLDDDITLDSVRYIATADGGVTLNFHLFSYVIDTSTNHGDLSDGTVQANASVAATNSTIKTGIFTLDSSTIDKDRVVIAFIENATNTDDVSVSIVCKYHIR